jgi:hypothetical protein
MNAFFVNSVQREIAQEKAQGLALTEKRLLTALEAYGQHAPSAADTPRERALWELVDAATAFVVQREACGLRDAARILKIYAVPAEIVARIGVRRQSASR